MATYPKDLGIATAYGYALSKGYTGTEEEFAQLMADYATVGQAAKESAEDSEAWAVGERDGVPVGSSDPAYHNNAEYYAEQASASAGNAANSETAAATSQGAAEAWSVGERGGVPVDGSDPTYHNNAKYYAEEAGESATAASGSATSAAASATAAAGSATTAGNKATEAAQSATAAAESATTAGTAATNAQAAQTAAETAQGKAEDAQAAAEAAAQTLVIDPTLTQPNQAAEAKATGDAISLVKSHLEAIGTEYLLNGYTDVNRPGYYGSEGEVISSTTFYHSETYVKIKPNTTYSVWRARYATSYDGLYSGQGVCFYDASKNFISRIANSHEFTSPANAHYIRTHLDGSLRDKAMLVEGTSAPTYFIPYGYDVITAYEEKCGESYSNSLSNELKLIDGLTIVDGTKEYTLDSETSKTATTGHYTNAIGVVTESASWNTYRCNIEPNAKYYVKASASSGAYAITVFDKNGKRLLALPSTLANSTLDGMIDTPATASYAILNASTSITVSLKKVIGIIFSTTTDTSASVLFGKKLYCGGDSITEGANVGSFPNGYKKTYGGFVATRNSMTYVADGVGGSTMGKCTIDGAVHNNFITSRYQNIPTDADYITLWFGWNDQAYGWKSARDAYCVATYGNYYTALTSAEQETVDAYKTWRQWLVEYAGTKNSTDITTWGGAWNTVLTWLLNNCDESHVGVVIAYGISDELSSVLIAICEKYGIPYVKAYDPHEFFSVGHSQGIGTDQATRRKSVYTLDNTHPNELGYEMMSNSYEQFLLRT